MTMPRNIKPKAHVENVEAFTANAAAIADGGPIEIAQDNTFFRYDSGRLKLRAFSNGTGELICYLRPNQSGPSRLPLLLSVT
jgi:hypothetical protein